MTLSAPIDRTRSTLAVLQTPVTSAPSALAICTAYVPTPPDTPMISTFCPASRRPTSQSPRSCQHSVVLRGRVLLVIFALRSLHDGNVRCVTPSPSITRVLFSSIGAMVGRTAGRHPRVGQAPGLGVSRREVPIGCTAAPGSHRSRRRLCHLRPLSLWLQRFRGRP